MTEMRQNQNWQDFSMHFNFDPTFGYLIKPGVQISSFNYAWLQEKVRHICEVEGEALEDELSKFQGLNIVNYQCHHQSEILRDFFIVIIHKLLLLLKKKNVDQELRIPRSLAIPFYKSSQQLGVVLGMSNNITFLLKPLNDNYLKQDESFGFGDFQLKYYFTKNKYQQTLFFGGSIIAALYLARINRLCFQINSIITQQSSQIENSSIGEKLNRCLLYWNKIIKENQRIIDQFDPHYFFYQLRPCIASFNGVILEGVNNGQDLRTKLVGGTAGTDPSFQIFEKYVGLKFDKMYEEMQQELRTRMSSQHNLALKYIEFSSQIRIYCGKSGKLKQEYNKTLEAYLRFLLMHAQFIEKYILNNLKEGSSKEEVEKVRGTAGLNIKDLIDRYKQIENHYL